MDAAKQLRGLPSVDEVLRRLEHLAARYPRVLVVAEVRRALEEERQALRAGHGAPEGAIDARVEQALARLAAPSLQRVINATGVILHTNLGRAPLPAFVPLTGYSNLEYDLAAGGEVIVSRGELIEIGDGFRIPDIMTHSGAVLREVGTTNRTHIDDYRAALSDRTRLLLRVHLSNFRLVGFTARPELKELVALAREKNIPLYEDLGSGCLVDLRPYGVDEPLAQDSLGAGVDLVSFSGDKLLGGPQAGILAGNPELVARLRRNPMYRALRLDKLIYQALEAALRSLLLERYEEVPALRMIRQSAEKIRARAAVFLKHIPNLRAELAPGESMIGGGATPEQPLPTWLITLALPDVVAAEAHLRAAEPPVLTRIADDRLLIDLRTVFPEEEAELARALQALS